MKILKKWNSISLVKRIIAGLIAGIILGLVLPKSVPLGILGDMFVGALKALAPLLVIVNSDILLKAKGGGGGSKRGEKVWRGGWARLAAFTAVAASYIFPSELVLSETAEGSAPQGIGRFWNLY